MLFTILITGYTQSWGWCTDNALSLLFYKIKNCNSLPNIISKWNLPVLRFQRHTLDRLAGLGRCWRCWWALWPFTFFPSWQRGSVSGRPCPSTLHYHQHAAMPSLPSLLTSNCAPSSPSQLIMNGLSSELRESQICIWSVERREETDCPCPAWLSKQQQTSVEE